LAQDSRQCGYRFEVEETMSAAARKMPTTDDVVSVKDKVSAEEWERVCRRMEAALREGRHGDAVVAGVEAVSPIIARHFPPRPGGRNELPDAPASV